MKKVTFILALAASVFAIDATQAQSKKVGKAPVAKTNNSGATQKVDTKESNILWTGKKVTGQHNGAVKIDNGVLTVKNGQLTGGNFDIDMNSITVEDIKDAEMNGKLVGHLKADDFFGVEKHPKANFKITKVAKDKAGKTNITGDLTIKGITHSVTFPAVVKTNKNRTEATANIVVDRSKYDIRYGSTSFFEGLGDKAIYDNFDLVVKLVTENNSL